jgi:hypothetical protein
MEANQKRKKNKHKYASPKDIQQDPYPSHQDIFEALKTTSNCITSFNCNTNLKKVKKSDNYNLNPNSD